MDVQLDVQNPVEHEAYLVSRGVRPMSLLGSCALDNASLARAWGVLSQHGQHDVIPFVIPAGERALFGFAASGWVVRLYAWLARTDLPVEIADSIQGLLLGYSVQSIEKYTDRAAALAITQKPNSEPNRSSLFIA